MMFHCFPQSSINDPDVQMEAYMFAVEEFDFVDVDAAIRRVVQGGEGHERRSFAPSTAELCQEIRRRKEMREIMHRREARGEVTLIKGGKS